MLNNFIDNINESLKNNTFVKITISSPLQKNAELTNIYVKQIEIKGERKLSFTFRYKKRDEVKNYAFAEAVKNIKNFICNDFRFATLFTISGDFLFQRQNNSFKVKQQPASIKELPSLNHNKEKNHKLAVNQDKKYLHLLGITDANGNVLPKSQDKYKQITHYIEILSSYLHKLPNDRPINVADMGCGKGYLTFALYDYLSNTLNIKAKVIGVEIRTDMVALCNKYAQECNFTGLQFVESSIADFQVEHLDVLIALHACNTATDDAIAKGINAGAEIIVTAPCCQHQVRQEMEKGKPSPILSPVLQHGIFLERQAELVTDTIRVLYLQYHSYKAKVVEFISDAHTHKNVMIIAAKSSVTNNQKDKIIEQLDNLKQFFGINKHYIEGLWQK